MGHVFDSDLYQLSGLHLNIELQVPGPLWLKVVACTLVFDDSRDESDADHVLTVLIINCHF